MEAPHHVQVMGVVQVILPTVPALAILVGRGHRAMSVEMVMLDTARAKVSINIPLHVYKSFLCMFIRCNSVTLCFLFSHFLQNVRMVILILVSLVFFTCFPLNAHFSIIIRERFSYKYYHSLLFCVK